MENLCVRMAKEVVSHGVSKIDMTFVCNKCGAQANIYKGNHTDEVNHEDGCIVDGGCDHATNRTLDVTVVVNVGVIERDLTAPPQAGCRIGFTLDEDVDEPAFEILGTGAFGQREAGRSDRPVHTFLVQRILHHVVPDAVSATGSRHVSHDHGLCLIEFNARRA